MLGVAVGQLPSVLAGDPPFTLIIAAVAMLGLLVGDTVLASAQLTTFQNLSQRTERDVLLRLARLYLHPVGVAHLEDPEFANRTQRVRDQVWQIDQGLFSMARPISGALMLTASCAVLAVTASAWGALLLAAASIAVGVLRVRLANKEMDVWFGHTEEQGHADYAFGVATGLAPAEVRIFELSEWVGSRFWRCLTAARQTYWRQGVISSRWIMLADLVRAGLAIGVIAAIVKAALDGQLGLAAAASGVPLVLVLANSEIGSLELTRRGVLVLSDLMETEQRYGTEPPPVLDPVSSAAAPEITFEDVTFSYPGGEAPVVEGLTLRLRAGESVALVGVNGAGKSTLIRLLTGALTPSSGRILVDGVDLARATAPQIRQWQRRVAVVTQDFCRYPLSARDNVTFGIGRPATAGDQSALDTAASDAGATDLIADLENGWDTVLDPTFDGGQDLSGGEWQRIALARARLAINQGAGALILDEPAAALDVRSEADLVDRHLQLAQGLTSLLVSHRFSVVRPIPRILVLDHGRVVEDGAHDRLMSLGGRYARMFTVQSERILRDDTVGETP